MKATKPGRIILAVVLLCSFGGAACARQNSNTMNILQQLVQRWRVLRQISMYNNPSSNAFSNNGDTVNTVAPDAPPEGYNMRAIGRITELDSNGARGTASILGRRSPFWVGIVKADDDEYLGYDRIPQDGRFSINFENPIEPGEVIILKVCKTASSGNAVPSNNPNDWIPVYRMACPDETEESKPPKGAVKLVHRNDGWYVEGWVVAPNEPERKLKVILVNQSYDPANQSDTYVVSQGVADQPISWCPGFAFKLPLDGSADNYDTLRVFAEYGDDETTKWFPIGSITPGDNPAQPVVGPQDSSGAFSVTVDPGTVSVKLEGDTQVTMDFRITGEADKNFGIVCTNTPPNSKACWAKLSDIQGDNVTAEWIDDSTYRFSMPLNAMYAGVYWFRARSVNGREDSCALLIEVQHENPQPDDGGNAEPSSGEQISNVVHISPAMITRWKKPDGSYFREEQEITTTFGSDSIYSYISEVHLINAPNNSDIDVNIDTHSEEMDSYGNPVSSVTWNLTPSFPDGSYSFRCKIVDKRGGTTTGICSFTIRTAEWEGDSDPYE